MDIVHIASECAPFAKVGGLGDMVYGLARASIEAEHHVSVFIPKYDVIKMDLLKELKVEIENLPILENGVSCANTIWSCKYEKVSLFFLEAHPPSLYFSRDKIYGEEDDNDRFIYFCAAAMRYLLKNPPDIIHLHDWPSALCALITKQQEKIKTRVIYTIHNMEYQGRCSPENFKKIGLKPEDYENELEDPQNSEDLNLVRGALKYSDRVTAVSPTYAKEIQTPEGGFGLHNDLFAIKHKLRGVLNGIDIDYWNPETDPSLIENYAFNNHFDGKEKNKRHLQNQFGFEKTDRPLVTSITRLVPQKGPDLIYYGIEKTLELGGQFILLGSCYDPETLDLFENMEKAYADHPQLAICLDYDESLSHLLFAGADMFLMPSIFEPCGLTQLIAMHYGTVPLVHRTGGLKDTVFDPDASEKPNGFSFTVPDNRGVATVLERAFSYFLNNREEWQNLIKNAMEMDVSWALSAKKYLEIYTQTK